MKVRFEKRDETRAVGYLMAPKPGDEGKGAYWAECDYSGMSVHDYAKLVKKNFGDLGMWYHDDKGENLAYFFGPIVEDFGFVPENMKPVTLPAASYAVFTSEPVDGTNHKNLIAAARDTWKYIREDWLKTSGYATDTSKFAFELYWNEAGCDGSAHATMEVWVPVKEK